MFKIGNSIQLTALFAGLPFLIWWLSTNPFAFASLVFWFAIGVYAILFALVAIALHHAM